MTTINLTPEQIKDALAADVTITLTAAQVAQIISENKQTPVTPVPPVVITPPTNNANLPKKIEGMVVKKIKASTDPQRTPVGPMNGVVLAVQLTSPNKINPSNPGLGLGNLVSLFEFEGGGYTTRMHYIVDGSLDLNAPNVVVPWKFGADVRGTPPGTAFPDGLTILFKNEHPSKPGADPVKSNSAIKVYFER